MHHPGFPEGDSGEPRKRRRSVTPARRQALRPLLSPRRPYRGPVFPGDAWATAPIAADFDPLWDDYDF